MLRPELKWGSGCLGGDPAGAAWSPHPVPPPPAPISPSLCPGAASMGSQLPPVGEGTGATWGHPRVPPGGSGDGLTDRSPLNPNGFRQKLGSANSPCSHQ